jgi:hypothetical protein
MNVADLLTVFRGRVDDTAKPYFWSDEEFYVYLTDAANQYCRYGRPIADHTSALTTIDYTADNPWILYDERILKVVSAFDVDNSYNPLEIIDWDEYKARTKAYPDTSGSISRLILGMEEERIRLDAIPIVDGILSFVLHRIPLKSISESNQKFEGVRPVDRLALLDWVVFRCYGHEDSETFNADKSEAGYKSFMSEMYKVRSEDMKRSNVPKTARYGGI